jgi:uncharacterized protein YkwD
LIKIVCLIKSLLVVIAATLFFCSQVFAESLLTAINKDYHNAAELDTAYNTDYLSSLEKAIIFEMNKARTNPKKYAELNIQPMLKRFSGNKYFYNNKTYKTVEGKSAAEECIRYLINAKPSVLLYPDEDLSKAAREHMTDQGMRGAIGHTGSDQSTPMKRVKKYARRDYAFIGENISYGLTSASEIISFLLINDGMPSRRHREILMNPKVNLTGVSCGYHKFYKTMCVIVYGRL